MRLKLAIIGVGTVGSSVANILKDNEDIITARAGVEIIPIIGVVNNLYKKRDVFLELTNDVNKVLEDETIDIIVELMGDIKISYEVIKKALSKGKAVVTANKALLAYHRYDLEKIAQNVPFEYEAAVAGGIPVISALREGLTANNIISIQGIMNGTCNYILTKMIKEDKKYEDVLKQAQQLGYAEANPALDVGGFDTAHKLLILSSIAYGIDAKPEDILIEGIENITKCDIEFGKRFNYSIKLLGITKRVHNSIEIRVHPVFIPKNKMLAKIDGVMNGICINGDKVGETMYYGAGAGGDATASAVIANIIDITRHGKVYPMLGFKTKEYPKRFSLLPKEFIQTKYYLRLETLNTADILVKITLIFENLDILIENIFTQAIGKQKLKVSLTTQLSMEKNISKVIKKLKNDKITLQKPTLIRIEE